MTDVTTPTRRFALNHGAMLSRSNTAPTPEEARLNDTPRASVRTGCSLGSGRTRHWPRPARLRRPRLHGNEAPPERGTTEPEERVAISRWHALGPLLAATGVKNATRGSQRVARAHRQLAKQQVTIRHDTTRRNDQHRHVITVSDARTHIPHGLRHRWRHSESALVQPPVNGRPRFRRSDAQVLEPTRPSKRRRLPHGTSPIPDIHSSRGRCFPCPLMDGRMLVASESPVQSGSLTNGTTHTLSRGQ